MRAHLTQESAPCRLMLAAGLDRSEGWNRRGGRGVCRVLLLAAVGERGVEREVGEGFIEEEEKLRGEGGIEEEMWSLEWGVGGGY